MTVPPSRHRPAGERSTRAAAERDGGGVVTFVDAEARIGFAYLNNASWSGTPGADPRAGGIVEALYSCL